MIHLYDNKPIIACSTGTQSNSAIGLIRISGFRNLLDFQKFFSFDLQKIKPRFNHFSKLFCDEKVIDEIVLCFYEGPKSFNGENILELGVHGNQLNIQRILKLFIESDLVRHANEGEFSYRALRNKKLSLSQVEGLDLLLNANSSYMLDQGLDVLQGDLYKQYLDLHSSFLKLKSSVELSIDFAEDIGEEQCEALLNSAQVEFSTKLNTLHKRIKSDKSDLACPAVSLIGQTNAGKSSLFNLLLSNERSIVSEQAGTTRDYVSEYLNLGGNNFRLIDTAGLRETNDKIEKIGIDRTIEIASKAFFKVLVVNPLQTRKEDYTFLGDEEFDLLIVTHRDLKGEFKLDELMTLLPTFSSSIFVDLTSTIDNFEILDLGPIEPLSKSGPIEPLSKSGPIEPLSKSGPIEPLSESGPIEPLDQFIENLILKKFNSLTQDKPLLVDRHRQVISSIYLDLVKFQQVMRDTGDIAIISSEMNILGAKVAELVGVISPDEILNNIFSNFCIGK